MKKLFVWFVFFCLVLTSVAFAAPTIKVYRYRGEVKPQKIDITKPINILSVIKVATQDRSPWVEDETSWPVGKRVLLLFHGFPFWTPNNCRKDLIELADHFSQNRAYDWTNLSAYDVIYAVEYPEKFHIIDTAAVLANIVNNRCAAWPQDKRFDLFAHSMGGLVARAAIELPKDILGTEPIAKHVAHLLMMGTPNNGFTTAEIAEFEKAFKGYPEVDDMLESLLNGQLNIVNTDKLKVNCDYYMLVGTCSWKPKLFQQGLKGLVDRLEGTHDGLVDTDSAGYDLSAFCHSYKKVELSVNHNYIKSGPTSDDKCKEANQSVFNAIDKWMAEDSWFETRYSANPFEECFSELDIMEGTTFPNVFGSVELKSATSLDKMPSFTNNTNMPDAQHIDYCFVFRRPTNYPSTVKDISFSAVLTFNGQMEFQLSEGVELIPGWQCGWVILRSGEVKHGDYEIKVYDSLQQLVFTRLFTIN